MRIFTLLITRCILLLCAVGLGLNAQAQDPVFNGFSPASGPVGTSVTITGSNLTDVTSVSFRGIGASFTVVSDTEISTAVPSGATTGTISVSNLNGTATSASSFEVIAEPVVTSFFPPTGVIGTSVNINGRGFTQVSSVTFNGVSANFTTLSPFTITAIVPAGATSGPITVTNPAGSGSSTDNFLITPPRPTITSFTPTSGPVGQSVVITGTDFLGATSVKLRNTEMTSFVVNSATQITAVIPTETSGLISVTTAGGTALSSTRFTVVPPPTITSFSPSAGAVGSSVLIQGTNLIGVSSVRFANNVSATFTSISTRSLRATVPAGAITGKITITATGGTVQTATNFIVSSSVPFITSFTPTSGNATVGVTPGTLVTINGGNFINGGTQVFFNGAPATTVTFVNSTRVRAIVPAGASTGLIRVRTANGQSFSSTNFVVNNATNTPPTLSTIADQRGCADSPITINFVVGDGQTPAADLVVTASATPNGVITVGTPGGSGPNRFVNLQAVNPATGGTATVTVTVTDEFSTETFQTFDVTFDQPLVVSAGSDQTAPTDFSPVSLNGSITGAATALWTTSGTGTFTDNSQVATTYNPSFGDYLAGSVVLTLTGTPNSPNTCPATPSSLTVTFSRPNLVVSSAQNVSGLYNDITVTSSGTMTVDGMLDVDGTFNVAGVLQFDGACEVITGSGSFTLQSGATMRICHTDGIADFGQSGQIQMTGGRSYSSNANYIYNGATAQSTGSGLPSMLDLGDLTIDNTNGVDLSQNLGAHHVVRLSNGNLRQDAGALTILSDANGTGMVVNDNGVVIGDATVQRYINPGSNAAEGYRHLSSPVISTTILDLATSGFVPVVNLAYNSTPLPQVNVRPYPTVFGFDESRNPSSSNFVQGYFSPSSTTDPLEWGRGYSVFMQGGSKPDFVGTLGNGTMTRTGLTRTGNFSGGSQKSGWHLLGNPYPSPIDWDMVTIPAGLSTSVSVYRSTGSSHLAGTYQVYVNGVGTPGTDLIGIAQGFFVRALQNNVTFTLTNACRLTEYADAAVFRSAPDTRPMLGLTLAAAGASADETADAYVYFQEGATLGYDDAFDGARPGRNDGVPTLASLVAGEELAINGLGPEAMNGTRVPLLVDVPTTGRYEFGVKQFSNLSADVLLYDAVTRTSLPINDAFRYSFTTTTAGEQTGRFSLVFGKSTAQTALVERLNVYPNPATSTVRVAGTVGQTIQVIDALGRVVRTQQVGSGAETVVSLTGVPAGVYSVRCGEQSTRLVIE